MNAAQEVTSEREAALMVKLEAAERERDECNRRRLEAADHFAAQTALMKKKYDDLRAKIEAMERQEPVGRALLCVRCSTPFDGEYYCPACGHHTATEETVYALPGATGE